jgi:hypothetical protein
MSNFGGGIGGGSTMKGGGGGTSMPHVVVFEIFFFLDLCFSIKFNVFVGFGFWDFVKGFFGVALKLLFGP